MRRSIVWLLVLVGVLLITGGLVFFLTEEQPTVFEQPDTTSEVILPLQTPASLTPASQTFTEILPGDCANDCESFRSSPDQYAYCRNVCGLSPDPTLPAVEPTDSNLKNDFIQKDTAIKESNLSACEKITDSALRKACQVRVTEDLLE